MTTLSELQQAIGDARRTGEGDPNLRGIAYDSRQVRPGDLFVCVRGFKSDGREYLPDALRRGAAAAVLEEPADDLSVPALLVPSAREAMARVAAAFYDYPSRELQLVGVTGTNGKTTTTYFVANICRAAGRKPGVIGTIGCRIGDDEVPVSRTTPEAPDLQELFRRMVDEGVRCAAMEVSSHALALQRTLGCEFDVGVFTNLTQDHLDFHKDIEDYFRAKAMLFEEYPRESEKAFRAVVNADDPYGQRLASSSLGRVTTYAVECEADLRALDVEATATSLAYTLAAEGERRRIRVPVGGRFNVDNSLAAIGAARALGIEWDAIEAGLAAARGVPGRFESVDEGQPFSVIVDYAHSPDGLENVLRSARALEPKRLTVVFGCGGDRDRGKRPIMGEIGARLADQVVLTSDNPRTEDPEGILKEIRTGIPLSEEGRVTVDADRRNAIFRAIQTAQPGDLVVIAGKGHETYQIFADRTIDFDDREVAREAIRARQDG